jgi:hypothetical protein
LALTTLSLSAKITPVCFDSFVHSTVRASDDDCLFPGLMVETAESLTEEEKVQRGAPQLLSQAHGAVIFTQYNILWKNGLAFLGLKEDSFIESGDGQPDPCSSLAVNDLLALLCRRVQIAVCFRFRFRWERCW